MKKMTVNIVDIPINGCIIRVFETNVFICQEYLKDTWIDGHRIYIEDNRVKICIDSNQQSMSWETLRKIHEEEFKKRHILGLFDLNRYLKQQIE